MNKPATNTKTIFRDQRSKIIFHDETQIQQYPIGQFKPNNGRNFQHELDSLQQDYLKKLVLINTKTDGLNQHAINLLKKHDNIKINKSSNDQYQNKQFQSSNRKQQATYGVNKTAYQVERIMTDQGFLKEFSPQRSVLLSVHQPLRNISYSSIYSFSKLFSQKSLPNKFSADSITPKNLKVPLNKGNSSPMKFIQKIKSHQSYLRKYSQDLNIKRLVNEDREKRLSRLVSQEKKQSQTYSRAYLNQMTNQSYVQDQPLLKYSYKYLQQKSSQLKCDICLQPQEAQSIFLNTKCSHKWCINCVLKRPHYLNDQKCYLYTNCGESLNEREFTLFYDQCAKLQPTINVYEEQNIQQQNLSNTQCEICKQKQPSNLIFMNSKCNHKWCFDCIAAMQGQNNENSCCIWNCRSPLDHTEMHEFYQNRCEGVIKEKEKIKIEENNNLQTLNQVSNNNNNDTTYNIIILFNQQEIELSIEINNLKVGMNVVDIIEEALKNKQFILKKPQMFIMLGKLTKIPLSNEMKVVDILKIYPDKKTLIIKEQQS